MENTEVPKELILLVDDNVNNLQMLGLTLRDAYKTIVANSGPEALEAVRKKQPDLILLDIMMPGMDGYTVCEILKSDPDTRDIPVIFLTARTETEDAVRGFRVGAADYVTKPFNTAELMARVHTHLELRRTRRCLEEKITALEAALAKVRQLSGMLPICASCKRIRDDKGYWNQIEGYIRDHSEAEFSHSICPECARKLYPDFVDEME